MKTNIKNYLIVSIILLIPFLSVSQWLNYCQPTATNQASYNCGIREISLGSLSTRSIPFNFGTNSQFYYDSTGTSFSAVAGSTLPISALNGTTNSTRIRVYADWNRDGTYNNFAPELIWENGTGAPNTNNNAFNSGTFSIPIGQAPGAYRIRCVGDIGFATPQPCALQYTGNIVDYTLVVTSPTTDAQAIAMLSPAKFIQGNNVVSFRAANLSNVPMTSLSIGYQLNNNAPVVQNLTGLNIPEGGIINPSFSTLLNLPSSGAYSLKVWVGSVNGIAPSFPATLNDTLKLNIQVCDLLNGTYTINPLLAPSASNFQSFNAAIAALECGGLSGSVVFNVANGTYNEQLSLTPFFGLSSFNQITFQSASGNPNNVTIQHSSFASNDNFVVNFSGASYITFKDISLQANGASFGTTVRISSQSHYDSFINVRFIGTSTTSTSTNLALVFANNLKFDYWYFGNCTFLNGSYGTYLNGSSSNSVNNTHRILTIANSTFTNQYLRGMHNYGGSGLRVINNKITTNSALTSYRGIHNDWVMSLHNDDEINISGNEISGAQGGAGIYLNYLLVNSSSSVKALISNNMIQIGNGGSSSYGIYIQYAFATGTTRFYNILHNTINVTSTSSAGDAAAIYLQSGSTGGQHIIRRNILTASNGAHAIRCDNVSLFPNIDSNNLFSTSNIGRIATTDYATLANWQSASSRDLASTNTSPNFVSSTNLRLLTSPIRVVRTLPEVSYDIDSVERCGITDIGAQHSAYTNDIGIVDAIKPSGNVAAQGLQDIILVLQNFGSNVITSANVSYRDNIGMGIVTQAWTGSLNPCDTVHVILSGANQFNFVGAWNLSFFTSIPNGVADSYNLNDTLHRSGCIGMIGTYTIGGVAPDFTDIANAVIAMNSCGLAGPVHFEVRAGSYGRADIPSITNASAVNTVTFEGVNKTSCVLSYATTNATNNQYVLRFNNTSNITFRNFTLRSSSTSFGWVVHFLNGQNNRVRNCIIEYTTLTPTNANLSAVWLNASSSQFSPTQVTTVMNNVNIDSNVIQNCYTGIHGHFNNASAIIYASENVFNNVYNQGVNILGNCAVKLNANTINISVSGLNTSSGISLNGLNPSAINTIEIRNNKILNPGNIGISIVSCSGSGSSLKGQVYNNFIGGGFKNATSGIYGILCIASSGFNFYHNSLNLDVNNSNNSSAAFFGSGGTNNSLVNNLFAITASSSSAIPAIIDNTNFATSVDFNNYYNNSSNFAIRVNGVNYSTLNYRSAFPFGGGANSESLNPVFVSNLDLTSRSNCAIGTDLNSEVPSDIFGVVRGVPPYMGANEVVFNISNDLGIETIINPIFPMATGFQTISAVIKNYGDNVVTSADIVYSLNGGAPVTFSWSGTLPSCDTIHIFFPTLVNFAAGSAYNIVVYTSLPNGIADPLNTNDTAKIDLCPALNGIYEIGTTGDFLTVNDAVDALICGGMSGPVTFNIQSGTYNEQFNLPSFNRLNSTDKLVFKSLTGINSDVTISYNATGSSDNYIINFTGASNVSFRNITLSPLSTSFARALVLTIDSDNDTFENIRFLGQTASSNNANLALAGCYDATVKYENWCFNNCHFVLGSIGTSFRSSNTNNANVTARGLAIINSTFNNQYARAIDISFMNGVYIYNNSIVTNSTWGGYRGVFLNTIMSLSDNDKIRVLKNHISGSERGAGIYVQDLNILSGTDSLRRSLIANNMIQIGSGNAINTWGIQVRNDFGQTDVIHNTVNNTSTNNTSAGGIILESSGLGANPTTRVFNNIFAATQGGLAIRINNMPSLGEVNFNNLFTTGSNLASDNTTVISNIADWRTAMGWDINSININPQFISATDLHSLAPAHIDTGKVTDIVLTDFDNETRCPNAGCPGGNDNPCMGADEYTLTYLIRDNLGDYTPTCLDLNGSDWINIIDNNSKIVMSINPNGNNLGNTCIGVRILSSPDMSTIRTLDISNAINGKGYALDRNFFITPTTQPITPVSVRLYFLNTELSDIRNVTALDAVNSESDSLEFFKDSMIITRYFGSTSNLNPLDDLSPATTEGIPFANVVNYSDGILVEFNTNAFSEFTPSFFPGSTPTPLPVSFVAFEVQQEASSHAKVSWKFNIDKPISHYELQRAINPTDFESIKSFTEIPNQFLEQNDFTDLHAASVNPTLYYRIKIWDIDGNITYSPSRRIIFENPEDLYQIFPVPFSNEISIHDGNSVPSIRKVKISDITGKTVLHNNYPSPSSTMNLNTQELKSGIYFMEIFNLNTVFRYKIVKSE